MFKSILLLVAFSVVLTGSNEVFTEHMQTGDMVGTAAFQDGSALVVSLRDGKILFLYSPLAGEQTRASIAVLDARLPAADYRLVVCGGYAQVFTYPSDPERLDPREVDRYVWPLPVSFSQNYLPIVCGN